MSRPVENTEIFAREWGPSGRSDAFLFIHGIESHSGWFEMVAGDLASRGLWSRAFDRGGWGQSPGRRGHVSDSATVLTEAAMNLTTLKQRGARRIHLIGQSWGAMAAMALADEFAADLACMTLISPGLFPRLRHSAAIGLRTISSFCRIDHSRTNIDLGFTPGSFSPLKPSQDFIAADTLRVTSVTWPTILTTLTLRRRCAASVKDRRFPVPTQMLIGSEDLMIDHARTAQLAVRNGGELKVIANAGHALVLDAHEAVSDALLRFHDSRI